MSISKHRLKLLLWLILSLVFGGIVYAVVAGVAALAAYFQQGADPAQALNIVPNKPPDLYVKLVWKPDDPDTGREMEPLTRRLIEGAYLRAWLQWNISHLRGQPYGLRTYFVGPTLDNVSETVRRVANDGWHMTQVDTEHTLTLHFYSADGSIASFTDENINIVQILEDEAGIQRLHEMTATYDVVMFLEDGNWRVRAWERRQARLLPNRLAPPHTDPLPGMVYAEGNRLMHDGKPFTAAGVNYSPADAPWAEFWTNYDAATVETDLLRIEDLGLNTLRIFVPFETFGGPTVDPLMRARLRDFLDRAEAHGLKVIVTLFDFRNDYAPLLWPHADRHLDAIVEPLSRHPAILAWDIKNEPDLDYEGTDPAIVNGWLTHVARRLRRLDPHHLITIGWAHAENADQLLDMVDVVSFHFYEDPATLPDAYAALRQRTTKPILLTEFGLSTWNSAFFPNGHTEAEQAAYIADVLRGVYASDMSGFLVWTLYDFEHVPRSVFGWQPWRRFPQAHMGILHSDGTPKPAAALVRPDAALDAPAPTPWARFFKPFWRSLYVVVVVGLFLLWRGARWWKRRRQRRMGL